MSGQMDTADLRQRATWIRDDADEQHQSIADCLEFIDLESQQTTLLLSTMHASDQFHTTTSAHLNRLTESRRVFVEELNTVSEVQCRARMALNYLDEGNAERAAATLSKLSGRNKSIIG